MVFDKRYNKQTSQDILIMKILDENTNKSQRKLWSIAALVIFIIYAIAILIRHWPVDIPTNIAYIIGAVVTYYFVKSTIKEAGALGKNKRDANSDKKENDKIEKG